MDTVGTSFVRLHQFRFLYPYNLKSVIEPLIQVRVPLAYLSSHDYNPHLSLSSLQFFSIFWVNIFSQDIFQC